MAPKTRSWSAAARVGERGLTWLFPAPMSGSADLSADEIQAPCRKNEFRPGLISRPAFRQSCCIAAFSFIQR